MSGFSRKSVVSVVALACLAASAFAETYKVDAVHSSVAFKIKHSNANHVYGMFAAPTGSVEITPEGGSVEVTVAVESVTTGNANRDKHIRGNDYFAAGQYPTISFKSTKVTKAADGTYSATGNLTLRGQTKEITIPLTVTDEVKGRGTSMVRGVETTFTINRSDYGMKEGIPLVGDEVTLMISLQAGR